MTDVIRNATSADITAIRDFDPSFDFDRLREPHSRHLVALEPGSDAPVAHSAIFHTPGYRSGSHNLYVMVHPSWRRRGLGTALVESANTWDPASSDSFLWARMSEEQADLRGLLDKTGFFETRKLIDFSLDLGAWDPSRLHGREITGVENLEIVTLSEESQQTGLRLWYEFEKGEGTTKDSFQAFRAWFVKREIPEEACFFAKLNGSYVGSSFLSLLNVKQEPGVIEQGYTHVSRNFRNRGIATALKMRTTRLAVEQGYRTLKTSTQDSNAAMLAINRKFGFQHVGSRIWMETKSA